MRDIGNLDDDEQQKLRRAILRALLDGRAKPSILVEVARDFRLRRTMGLKAEITRLAKRLDTALE